MVTVGQALTAPESGWKRYDERDSNIEYSNGFTDYAHTPSYNGTYKYKSASTLNDYIRFNFTGTRLRLINLQTAQNTYSSIVFVSIDGAEYSYSREYVAINQRLDFESPLLDNKEHYVKILVKDLKGFGLDAIDIYGNGELKPYNEDTSLKKLLLKSNNKVYSVNSSENITELPTNSLNNFIKYGTTTVDNFNKIQVGKNYILQDTISEDTDGLWKQELSRKPLSIKFE